MMSAEVLKEIQKMESLMAPLIAGRELHSWILGQKLKKNLTKLLEFISFTRNHKEPEKFTFFVSVNILNS